MGADLFLPSFKTNQPKCKGNFNKAVKARDSIFPRYFNGVRKINRIVREALQKSDVNFDDELTPIPENMTLKDQELNRIRDKYNRFVKAQARVTKWYNKMYEVGYFRDSYNGTSLFWRLGMSWWHCPYIKDGKITPENAKKLLDEVEQKELPPITAGELKEHHCKVDNSDNDEASWDKFFAEKKACFIDFLKEAIDNDYTIEASV